MTDLVRAAGGVPLQVVDGAPRVLLIHRRRYDDWTFPKGKVEGAETDEQCALREVEEETGLHCALEHELPSTTYRDPKGRPKLVRYWQLRVVTGMLTPRPGEVDDARWVSHEDALALLTHAHDRALLAHLEAKPR